jgi:hypothetical protein
MEMCNPKVLAAELRLRALEADPQERADLLFLAAEYDNMADTAAFGGRADWLGVPLPK